MDAANSAKFFLGANTPSGFVSYFQNCYGNSSKVFILKGSPGSGKSTMLNNIMQKFPLKLERIYCSSDPDSLDGILFTNEKICILDGTSPHVLEPLYVGAVERLVNIGKSIDCDSLEGDKDAIIALTEENKNLHKRATRYLNAAGSLIKDNHILELDAIDTQKIIRCVTRIAHREFSKTTQGSAAETIRFLSAVTPKGVVTFSDTIDLYADRIYNICNENGAVSKIFMQTMRKICLKSGLDIITCPCPLAPNDKIDHLIIPSERLAFTVTNKFHKRENNIYRNVHTGRFCDAALLSLCKEKIAFNHKAIDEIINESVLIMKQAKEVHDRLEALYGKHIKFDEVNEITAEVIAQIEKSLSV